MSHNRAISTGNGLRTTRFLSIERLSSSSLSQSRVCPLVCNNPAAPSHTSIPSSICVNAAGSWVPDGIPGARSGKVGSVLVHTL